VIAFKASLSLLSDQLFVDLLIFALFDLRHDSVILILEEACSIEIYPEHAVGDIGITPVFVQLRDGLL